jgi:ABC-type transport system substrate-binding protein
LFSLSAGLNYLIQQEFNEEPKRTWQLRIGAFGSAEYWDPGISDGSNILCSYYSTNCLESLFYFPEDSIDPESSLATSWDFEYWLEENNSRGFINRGGVKAINITLREGVKFHDGSSWNATVAKWNIDRLFLITGNLTGNGDMRNLFTYWTEVENSKPFFTANWNMSEYDAPHIGMTPPPIPLSQDNYSCYYLTDPEESSPIKVSNPNPYGGWDNPTSSPIHHAPYDMYPIIKWVEIIDNQISGGIIRIHYNSWNSDTTEGIMNLPMISMNSYSDYFDRGIYGYENGVLHSKNPTIINHMVGTGPYVYQEHQETEMPPGGYMIKNENYWNKSALEAGGWFNAGMIRLIPFPLGVLGKDALNTALLTHAIDYVIDENLYYPLDYDAIFMNPGIAYVDCGFTDYITQITLNCINETWWSWGPPYNYRDNISSLYSDQGIPNGIPRALRKAISFAFNYDSYISMDTNRRLIRSGGILGLENVFFNSNIPITDYNLTKAREILLTTEDDPFTFTYDQNVYNFSMLCSTRGLTVGSDNTAWQNIAETNPIFTLNFYWDNTHDDLKNIFQNSLKNIGIALNVTGTTNGIPNQIPPHFNTFDGHHSIWSSQSWSWEYFIPTTFSDLLISLSFRDVNDGSWRYDPWAPSTDPSFSWWPGSNFAFSYDEDIDNWLDRMVFSNRTEKLTWLSKIANKIQNEIYPTIFVSQGRKAIALWKPWEITLNRGILFFPNLRFIDFCPPISPPSIPGYSLYLFIAFIAVSSIILAIKKKILISKGFIYH